MSDYESGLIFWFTLIPLVLAALMIIGFPVYLDWMERNDQRRIK